MKQLLFILIAILLIQNTSPGQGTNPYDKTTWNVIRERLFSGENSKACRFEEDIRFQVIGAKTHQDSAVIREMIDELNNLIEIVQIEMVNSDPNFNLTVTHEPGGWSSNHVQMHSGGKIKSVKMDLGLGGAFTEQKSIGYIYYHTLRKLTKLYTPQHGSTGYGGIFDTAKAFEAEFKEIDKELLKKLYSDDFYDRLKESTIQRSGYMSYLILRYDQLIKNLKYALKAILLVFGFLYFLSRESKRKPNPGLFLYLKQRLIIVLIVPFFFSGVKTDLIDPPLFIYISFLVGVYLLTLVYALLVLVVMYYFEPVFLKRIHNFVTKQVFVFLSTIITPLIVSKVLVLLMALVFLLSGSVLQSGFDPISVWPKYSPQFFWVAVLAVLRVLYNFLNYRIQSMVNQKDVEIAKMKEQKIQAELNALHSRINPHFLYNSLNSIASLAHIDANKTENMATGLSELFRYSINKENKTYVTIAEELEMVKKYLDIEKMRFGDKLVYKITADDSTMEKQIPKFLIQPLVENAIKHGLSKIKGNGEVLLEVKQVWKDMTIAIFDSGPDFPAEPVGGYGLQNLHDKLDILYGDDAIINWENGEEKHFKVTLKNQFKS